MTISLYAHSLKNSYAADIAAWEQAGNTIKSEPNKKVVHRRIKHGTQRAYMRFGCRCNMCIIYADREKSHG